MTESDQVTPTEESTEPAGRRGRPRPQETLERDQKVLDSLNDADKTREQIAAELGVEPSHAYLSLFRLRRQGLVEKAAGTDGTKTNSWHRVST